MDYVSIFQLIMMVFWVLLFLAYRWNDKRYREDSEEHYQVMAKIAKDSSDGWKRANDLTLDLFTAVTENVTMPQAKAINARADELFSKRTYA
jgi:hypothetical protein